MPLLYIEKIDDNTQLGAWLFDKSTNLKNVCPSDVYNRTMTMCNNRQKETAAVYALLNEMLGRGGWTIDHEDSGRPILRGSDMEIGISHTKNYASIILSRHKRVAVDIEYISDRVFKIEDKFMRSDERDYSLTLCNNIKSLTTLTLTRHIYCCYSGVLRKRCTNTIRTSIWRYTT